MNNNGVDAIKKEDKKAFKGFISLMIISAIIGCFLGGMSKNLKQVFGENISNLLVNILQEITPFASLIISILIIIISKIIYSNSRKKYNLWKQINEDDDTIDKIEENLAYVLMLTSINTILGFFFIGVGMSLLPFNNINGNVNFIKIMCLIIGFILCFVSSILIQKNIINLEKEINPLLKGSIYDKNFSKKWLDSCDESIRLGIFKSSYKAYTSVTTTCIILWVACIIGYDLWDFGVMPMVMITIIWLVQTISYYMESIKSSKAKQR